MVLGLWGSSEIEIWGFGLRSGSGPGDRVEAGLLFRGSWVVI